MTDTLVEVKIPFTVLTVGFSREFANKASVTSIALNTAFSGEKTLVFRRRRQTIMDGLVPFKGVKFECFTVIMA